MICQPFGEEKQEAYRILTHFGRSSARLGIETIRVDYRGSGNSQGEHSEATMRGTLEDLAWLLEELKSEDPITPLGIMGIRLGSVYALQLAAMKDRILDFIVLWAPLLDTSHLLKQMLRYNLAVQMARHGKICHNTSQMEEIILGGGSINIEGYELNGDLYRSLNDFEISDFGGFSRRLHCFVIEVGERRVSNDKKLCKALEAMRVQEVEVTKRQFIWKEFWKEGNDVACCASDLENATFEWITSVAIADKLRANSKFNPVVEKLQRPMFISANGTSEQVFSFGKEGQKRFAIFHRPKENFHNILILANGGVKHCVGPHRLYVKIARALAEEGIGVLRFDPLGIGDSEGQWVNENKGFIFRSIQRGGFVKDTILALRFLREKFGVNRYFVGGLCGGALTALLVAAKEPSIKGVVLLNIPLLYYGSEFHSNNPGGNVDSEPGTMRHCIGAGTSRPFFTKVFRFLTGKSEYSIFLDLYRLKMRVMANKMIWGVASGLNQYFVRAWKTCIASRSKILLVFSEKDVHMRRFHDAFPFNKSTTNDFDHVQTVILRDADHVLTEKIHITEFNQILTEWLKQ